MDEKRPKRRKDKYNPYTISKSGSNYFLSFKDSQGVMHDYEIDRPLFDLFDSFELEDLSYLNVVDRHIEQSELTEGSLNKRAFDKPTSIEDDTIHAIQNELLHDLITKLPETQRRRLYLYYFVGLNYERIAELEKCTARAVQYSVEAARKNLRKKFEY